MFDIAKLTPSLFSYSTIDDVQDPRTSCINLVQMITRTIDHHKNSNILFFKEAIKIKEKNDFEHGFKSVWGITTILNRLCQSFIN